MLKIIISPAKKMNVIDEYTCCLTAPAFLEKTQHLHKALLQLSLEELKKLWGCSEKLAVQNYERLHTYQLDKNLTPALLAYEGIQYQYMAPHVFSDTQWKYVEQHLWILSGFYGILKPTDGVIPYRLEMQAKISLLGKAFHDAAPENISENVQSPKTLYAYWSDSLCQYLTADADKHKDSLQIVNLASAEYSKAILPYIVPPVTQVSCVFGEWVDGKIKVKGTQAKMARGEMVRWMSENQIQDVTELQRFDGLDYVFEKGLSSDTEYVFLKKATLKETRV